MTGTVVLDASAAVALLIDPGPAGEQVAARLDGASVVAPDLLPYEVTNVLRRQRNAGRLSDTEARLALEGLHTLSIDLWPHAVLTDRIWCLGANLSAYDAAYVALAERLGAVLLTADARIAGAPGITCPVEVVTLPR
ncbi:type II toxin-antitoxin system VapC family toxin [Cellulomonas humilata]|uniref:Ribonuclease VapC n=1 Tax=Cellulomonas humilata TaxID=144055 RepID=A0ABU0EB09_9CELL|nr:type II toxin-antitoxin system VapC family toxin [Cellulomonas humilata]MDQ0372454.1 putative nucleic acid-binding protein [Cellulomonas humilata]